MSVMTEEIPQVPDDERVKCRDLGAGFYQVVARYGFMETPDIPTILRLLGQVGPSAESKPVAVKPMETSFYLGRETVIATGTSRMARWRKKLFIIMARNAQSATAFFGLPPNRVVELGAQVQI
jgi:KUP system potassium uptake protein